MFAVYLLLATLTTVLLPASATWWPGPTQYDRQVADNIARQQNIIEQNRRRAELQERQEWDQIQREGRQSRFHMGLQDRLQQERVEQRAKQERYQRELQERLHREQVEREAKQAQYQKDLRERLERERIEREAKQAQYQRDLQERLHREQVEREAKQAQYQRELQERLHREQVEREAKQAQYQNYLRERLEREQIEREEQQRRQRRRHEYNMLKLRLRLKGPRNCKQIKNLANKKMYPKTNSSFNNATFNGYPLTEETEFKTYECTDPPRYPSKFYKVVSTTYGVVNGKRLDDDIMSSTNVNYYNTKDSEQLDWEPDMKKYRRKRARDGKEKRKQ